MPKPETHYEYAVQWCTYDIEGQPSWWIATEWYNDPMDAENAYSRFLLRNENAGLNPTLGKRMARRMVGEIEVLSAAETARVFSSWADKRNAESRAGR